MQERQIPLCAHSEGMRERGGIFPPIFNIGFSWNCIISLTPRPLYLPGKCPGMCSVEGVLGTIASSFKLCGMWIGCLWLRRSQEGCSCEQSKEIAGYNEKWEIFGTTTVNFRRWTLLQTFRLCPRLLTIFGLLIRSLLSSERRSWQLPKFLC